MYVIKRMPYIDFLKATDLGLKSNIAADSIML